MLNIPVSDFFTWWQALILGLVEGITEFLPVSSTAHLVLTSHVLRIPDSEFLVLFEVVVQAGAIAAVVVLYWRQLLDIQLWPKLLMSFVPTGLIAFMFSDVVKNSFLANELISLLMLGVVGVGLLFWEWLPFGSGRNAGSKGVESKSAATTTIRELTWRQCVLIGIIQSCAIVPGVSRSLATVVGGLSVGMDRKSAVEYSFLLAVPTLGAAAVFSLLDASTPLSVPLLGTLSVGLAAAFITSIIGMELLLRFTRSAKMAWFGVYRILLVAGYFLLYVR